METALFLLKATAIYFLSINVLYGLLMLFSWIKIKRFLKSQEPSEANQLDQVLPGVSFIIPVYNEEKLIVETIQTYFSLPQKNKEIIVINDGSHDQTLRLLQNMYQLRRDSKNFKLHHSITRPELKVIEAPHLGKAQALNFGINMASYDLICTMDADTIPNARGVETCLRAFAQDPKLVAAGGVIQVLNSSVIQDNQVMTAESSQWLPAFQRIEYLRAFICERLGWSLLRSTVLISGAFCMIKKEAVQKIGGFRQKSITEDLDVIIRLRKHYQSNKNSFRILPVTTCYTQVPNTYNHLKSQRLRWQQGLVQTLAVHPTLFLNPRHGIFGLLTIPYMWIVEVCSPIVEGIAWCVVPYSVYQGWIGLETVMYYLAVGVIFNVAITLFGIHLDNQYVSRSKTWSFFSSVWHTILLQFGYKQLNSWWRFLAILKSITPADWGDSQRQEIIHQQAA